MLDLFKFEVFPDDHLNVAKNLMIIPAFDRVKNTVEKRIKCRVPVSPFSTLFSEAAFFFKVFIYMTSVYLPILEYQSHEAALGIYDHMEFQQAFGNFVMKVLNTYVANFRLFRNLKELWTMYSIYTNETKISERIAQW